MGLLVMFLFGFHYTVYWLKKMSHPEFSTQMRSMISNFSCKVFTSKNATEMSKTRLKSGNWTSYGS